MSPSSKNPRDTLVEKTLDKSGPSPNAPGERKGRFATLGGIPLKTVYTQGDLAGSDRETSIGVPGEFPYTRGIYPTMYRGRLWTMRQYAGFGTAAQSNERYRYLLAKGQTGLSVAFDLPTQIGLDSDHARSAGEVGKVGVAIDSLEDMQTLFDSIPLERVSTSMTINSTAAILLALYVAVAKKQGADLAKLAGTVQNDILKEYIARGTYIYPPRPAMRIITDMFAWAGRELPEWNTISISGYHIREAGSTAVQELAFTFANAIAYIEAAMEAGLAVDAFAPRLSFFFNSHSDFLEEIAKFRAARRAWAKIMKTRFGAKTQESMRLRFHCQTAAATLTKPQYQINIVRTALQALSGVLGGCQSLHTNGYDEAFAIPTEEAMRVALRTQQIIAEEINVSNVVDPIGGCYFVESLTSEYEKQIFETLDYVDANGGTIKLIEEGWFQKQIADFSYETALRKQTGEKPVIGVNRFIDEEEVHDIETHPYDVRTAERQIARTKRVRAGRDAAKHKMLMEKLATTAKDDRQNIMPITVEAVENGATMGEIVDALKKLWGTYRENPVF